MPQRVLCCPTVCVVGHQAACSVGGRRVIQTAAAVQRRLYHPWLASFETATASAELDVPCIKFTMIFNVQVTKVVVAAEHAWKVTCVLVPLGYTISHLSRGLYGLGRQDRGGVTSDGRSITGGGPSIATGG